MVIWWYFTYNIDFPSFDILLQWYRLKYFTPYQSSYSFPIIVLPPYHPNPSLSFFSLPIIVIPPYHPNPSLIFFSLSIILFLPKHPLSPPSTLPPHIPFQPILLVQTWDIYSRNSQLSIILNNFEIMLRILYNSLWSLSHLTAWNN